MKRSKTVKYEETYKTVLNRTEAKNKNSIHGVKIFKEEIDRKDIRELRLDGNVYPYVHKSRLQNVKDFLSHIKWQIDELDNFNCNQKEIAETKTIFNMLIRDYEGNDNEIKWLENEGVKINKFNLFIHMAVVKAFGLGQRLSSLKYGDHVPAVETKYKSDNSRVKTSQKKRIDKSEPNKEYYLALWRKMKANNRQNSTRKINDTFYNWLRNQETEKTYSRNTLLDWREKAGL